MDGNKQMTQQKSKMNEIKRSPGEGGKDRKEEMEREEIGHIAGFGLFPAQTWNEFHILIWRKCLLSEIPPWKKGLQKKQ